jgi:hypothetical protein
MSEDKVGGGQKSNLEKGLKVIEFMGKLGEG